MSKFPVSISNALKTQHVFSLQGRTFLFYFITATLVVSICGIFADYRLSASQTRDIKLQLIAYADELKATILNESNDELRTTQIAPVYFHVGNAASTTQSANWPIDCGALNESDFNHRTASINCPFQRVAHILTTDIRTESSGKKQLYVWSVSKQAGVLSSINFVEMSFALILVAGLSLWASRKTTNGLIHPLKELSSIARRFKDGDYIFEPKSHGILEVDRIISELKDLGETLKQRDQYFRNAAFKDQLTGLDNRNFLTLNLNQHIRQANEPLMILSWSIDNLDEVYDVLGQETIEKILIQTGRKARRLCPTHLSLARLEGNQFCLVTPLGGSCLRPEDIPNKLFMGQLKLGAYSIDMRCHAGVATFPADGHDADTLIRRADVARQTARKSGQRLAIFTSKMEKLSRERLARVAELKSAIQQNEFELYLQPKLNIKTGQISQAECLLRWNHPKKGVVSPLAFIELAEQTGLIKDLSKWVLCEGYRFCEKMSRYNISVSLNMSAIDLADNDLLTLATSLHKQSPHLTRLITLEVTESCTMHDPEQARIRLNKFAELGFKISVDDFGSGYSSLSYLKRFPVSELKIDRSLVQGADKDTDAAIIIQSTIEMGHTMGLVVTVEGVETREELELVSELDADYIQGYILSAPLPLSEFRERFFLTAQDQVTQPV